MTSTSAEDRQQRGLGRSHLCNTYKVSVYGRKLAIQNFAEGIRADQKLREHLPRLAGKRLVCHCLPTQECHADSIVAGYKLLYPEAYDKKMRTAQFHLQQS